MTQSAPNALAIKRCTVCRLPVLSAYRGEVTAIGRSQILSVARDGAVIGVCACGARVVWIREASHVEDGG